MGKKVLNHPPSSSDIQINCSNSGHDPISQRAVSRSEITNRCFSAFEIKHLPDCIRFIGGKNTDKEMAAIAQRIWKRSPCRVLVYGESHNLALWRACNAGGMILCVKDQSESFCEEDAPVHVAYQIVKYGTKKRDWRNILNAGNELFLPLSKKYIGIFWDIIIVDGPKSNVDDDPGKMRSIFSASLWAKYGMGQIDVFICDSHRDLEAAYCAQYMNKEYLAQVVDNLAHYIVPTQTRQACLDNAFTNNSIIRPLRGKQIHLVSVIGGWNVAVLPFYLKHYKSIGVDSFHIVIHYHNGSEDIRDQAIAYLAEQHITPFAVWKGTFSGKRKGIYLEKMRKTICQKDDWIVWADMDEFHEYPFSLDIFTEQLEEAGYHYVVGDWIDRVALDGGFPLICPEQPLSEQFPLGTKISKELLGKMRGSVSKMMLAKGWVLPGNDGFHAPATVCTNPDRCYPDRLRVHHYKWDAAVVPKLQKREIYWDYVNPEPTAFAKHLKDHNGFLDLDNLSYCRTLATYPSQKSMLLFSVWLEPWPEWLDHFLLTCKHNPTISWIIVTNQPFPMCPPQNVVFKQSEELLYSVSPNIKTTFRPKVCRASSDLSVLQNLPLLFSDDAQDHDIIGVCLLSVLFGNIRRHISPSVLKNDAIIFADNYNHSHMVLVKRECLKYSVLAEREFSDNGGECQGDGDVYKILGTIMGDSNALQDKSNTYFHYLSPSLEERSIWLWEEGELSGTEPKTKNFPILILGANITNRDTYTERRARIKHGFTESGFMINKNTILPLDIVAIVEDCKRNGRRIQKNAAAERELANLDRECGLEYLGVLDAKSVLFLRPE